MGPGGRVLSAEWISESTSSHIDTGQGAGYGYQWWVRPSGAYEALGWGGQEILVFPQQDMVVAIMAGMRNAAWNGYDDLLNGYILPAVKSDAPLPPNPAEDARLVAQLDSIENPAARAAAALPAKAIEISGKTYVDLNGTHGWSTFQFDFKTPEEAGLEVEYGGEDLSLRIGLDGVYRVTDTELFGPVALQGYWQDSDTFVLVQQFLRDAERITMQMTFSGKDVRRHSEWTVEDHTEESEAVLLHP
jgi:hypothetical protein